MTTEIIREYEAPAYTELHTDDEVLWSEIVPGLWQGGTDDLDWMDSRVSPSLKGKAFIQPTDFDTVITLFADAKPVGWFVKEVRYGFWDAGIESIDFEEIFELVRTAHTDWKRGKEVLIRCQAGWNRSGLITALVLMREGLSARQAIDLQRDRRNKYVLCNRDFEEWLLKQNPEDWRGDSLPDTD